MATSKKTPTAAKPATKRASKPATPDLAPKTPSGVVLRPGDVAPEFALPSSEGRDIRLSDLRGKRVVLYFYPKDDTPGCTVEAKDFAAAKADFEARNTVVLGVSRDSVERHVRFGAKYDLGFPLLSDPDARVIDAYGAWAEKTLYGKTSLGIVRSTFVIDEAGIVRAVFPKVKVAGHVAQVLAALDA